MLLPGPAIKPSGRAPVGWRKRLGCLVGFALLVSGGVSTTLGQPVSVPVATADPFAFMATHPLTKETWPLWRETLVRISFDDPVHADQEKAFYKEIDSFFQRTSIPAPLKELESDPIAWVSLSYAYLHRAYELGMGDPARKALFDQAETACRKAIDLGDPRGIGSFSLATTLIYRLMGRSDLKSPFTDAMTRQLAEAEERLRQVEQITPQANMSQRRGQVALLRGDIQGAVTLLLRATEIHPHNKSCAQQYALAVLQMPDPSVRPSELIAPLVKRFPGDADILVVHAAALFQDERFPESAEALKRARQIDVKALQVLSHEHLKAIEQGRFLTANMLAGLSALKDGRYVIAKDWFLRARAKDPGNPLAARLLSRTIINQLGQRVNPREREAATEATAKIEELCRAFPDDPQILADLALALHLKGHNVAAARTLQRIERLGVQPEKFLDPVGVQRIRTAAESDETTIYWMTLGGATIGGSALWVALMFALGALLAVCIPRTPGPLALSGGARSRREVWLERFYLVILSIGLLVFYLSVPVVALGLLAVTLTLFLLMLGLRIVHMGVLHRGFWATWNVLRCALMGPRDDVVGIEATEDEHPRLFEASREVAGRLQTRPVDTIYLTPSSNIAVREDGSGPFGLIGRRRRVLQIGISTLPLLTALEFKSILAHEYGHFTHNDPFYSRFIFQVSASLSTSLAVMNAAGGWMNMINPFHWFWWSYLKAYTLLATGFSRLREFLADRQAAAAYGKQAFVSGLTKVSVDGLLFDSTVYANVRQLLGEGKAFVNAFDAFRQYRDGSDMAESRGRLLEHLRQTKPTWFDSHPTFSERLAAVADFPEAEFPGETEPAVELLSDPQALEAELTRILTACFHQEFYVEHRE